MKRFLITISLILGCALLFVVGLGVILALAPGSRIFGIEYVSAQVGKANVTEEWAEYINGDIYLNTKDVPITINFEPYGTTKVEFNQNFSGYTTGGLRVPEAEIVKDNNGITVKTNEIQKFLIGRSANYGLTLTLPSSWGTSGRHSIYIYGNNSKITVNADENITLKFVQLKLNGKGNVALNCKIETRDLEIYSPKSITVGQDLFAENITAQSHSGNINIDYALSGNLNVKTVSGNVNFISCVNATIETSSGKVTCNADSSVIYNKANITTKSGSVTLSCLMGTLENNNITTNSGSININTMFAGSLNSERGKISVNTLFEANVIGGTNTITIGSVGKSINIESKRGKVMVGSLDGEVANNVTVTTTTGDIIASNTSGNVSLTTKSGKVTLYNTKSNNVSINSGSTVLATGLMGSVNIASNGEMNLAVNSVNDDITITGGSKCGKINITFENVKLSEINYNITTTSKSGGIARIYSGQTVEKEGVSLTPETITENLKTLTINATKCKINAYFMA